MPRRKAAVKREVLPDPLYSSDQVAKFINVVMRAGKKSLAERIFYRALESLIERVKKEKDKGEDDGGKSGGQAGRQQGKANPEAIDLLDRALDNVRPTVEVKSRRVGGATYQVPVEVNPARGVALAMRWVVQAAKGRTEKTMALRLAAELYEAYMGRGASVKTRDDVHRMAKANQAFAHYRW
jgi:small subunit ribosomal protein S7